MKIVSQFMKYREAYFCSYYVLWLDFVFAMSGADGFPFNRRKTWKHPPPKKYFVSCIALCNPDFTVNN